LVTKIEFTQAGALSISSLQNLFDHWSRELINR
jgi:hypothetical protein